MESELLAELDQAEKDFEAEKQLKQSDWQKNQNRLELALAKLQLEESKTEQLDSKVAQVDGQADLLDEQIRDQQAQLAQLEPYETHLNDFALRMGFSHPMEVINVFAYYKSATAEARHLFAANSSRLQQLTEAIANDSDNTQLGQLLGLIEKKSEELRMLKRKRQQQEAAAEQLYANLNGKDN